MKPLTLRDLHLAYHRAAYVDKNFAKSTEIAAAIESYTKPVDYLTYK